MIYPKYIKFVLLLLGLVFIGIIVTIVLFNKGVISGTSEGLFKSIMCIGIVMTLYLVGVLLYALTFVNFSEEKIHVVSYTCFGIPIKSEYMINKINSVIIFYGKDTTIDFCNLGKNVLNLEIRDEVLKTVLRYIPHDVINVELQCPQKVKGEQQKLIKPFLSDKQKRKLHMKEYTWCDE